MSFFVIEGLDGSGKSTQVELFRDYLHRKGIAHHYLHFPVTDSPVFGELVAKFLRGELGSNEEVNPYLVALLYAGDRNNAKAQIGEWLNAGDLVLVDRYVHSNMAFQCAKLEKQAERIALRDWIAYTEYSYFGIPIPDKVIYLDVPFSFTRHKLAGHRAGDDRDYLQGKTDIHEADLDFQERVRREYLDLLKWDNSITAVNCQDGEGHMLPPETIHERVVAALMD